MYCIRRIPPLKFHYLAPVLPCSLLSSRNPFPARFLPPTVHASFRPFLACSLHQPSLPPLRLSACIASSILLSLPLLSPSLLLSLPPLVPSPTSPCSRPSPLLLFPLLRPPSLAPCLPLPACYIPPFNSMYVCLIRCIVLYSAFVVHATETME